MLDELAYYWTIKRLVSKEKIEAVIITNSCYLKQPLWLWDMSKIKVHYFYYSTAPLIPISSEECYKDFAALELQSLFVVPSNIGFGQRPTESFSRTIIFKRRH